LKRQKSTIQRMQELEEIASQYHLEENIPDKFIEDICQYYCCKWMQSLISKNDYLIELGYGEGITTSQLKNFPKKYTLVEGSETLAEVAKIKHPEINVICNLFENFSPAESCDKLFALHVFEHVDDPINLAKHLKSWIKPNGELLAIVPNKLSLHRQLAVIMGLQPALDTLSARDKLVGHQRVYGIEELESDLQIAGFEVIESKGFFLKTLPNSMMLDYSEDLINALNVISESLPASFGANIAIRARPRKY
jgi:2-polyprenyl-3-methyl-5-hydroxy-6-metoxy-1,4-benzoquinol methylase